MNKFHCFCFTLCFLYTFTKAQELFPNTESASNTPKGVVGIRTFVENYKEINVNRNMFAVRLIYGITPKLSVYLQGTESNHHDTILPRNIVTHTHVGNQTILYTQNRVYGIKYPYRFNGFSLYAKYRFFSKDGQSKHLRMAVYAQASKVRSAHDEAEPRLMDDNSGYGGGLIVTQLYKKLAVSFTGGFIKPSPYFEQANFQATQLYYGDALTYDLSIGYLIYPKKYKSYDQDNYTIYAEFMGKAYKQARLLINNYNIQVESNSLRAGNYIDGAFGIQRIINSNVRIDVTVRLPLLNQSYAHFYPLYMIAWQKYLYPNKTKQKALK